MQRQLGTLSAKRLSSESNSRSVSRASEAPSVSHSVRTSLSPQKQSTTTKATSMLSYDAVFWLPSSSSSSSLSSSPSKDDARAGVHRLHEALAAHFAEVERVATFVKAKVAAEEQAARALDDLAALDSVVSAVPASAAPTLAQWSSILTQTAASHRRHADSLTQNILTPLAHFLAKHKKLMDFKKQEVDSHWSLYVKSIQSYTHLQTDSTSSPAARTAKRDSLTHAQHARSALEFRITDFLQSAQETSHTRLVLLKECFEVLQHANVSMLDAQLQVHLANQLVCVDPSQGTEEIAFQLQTGTNRVPPPPAWIDDSGEENFTPASFGASLTQLQESTHDPVPPFLRKCAASLNEGLLTRRHNSGIAAWLHTSMNDVPAIQILRMEAGSSVGGAGVRFSRVQRESPAVVAGVVMLFLRELPESLVSEEAYETLRIVYDAYETVDMDEDEEIRLKTVSSLLMTLPESHYETLKLMSGLLYRTTIDLPDTSSKLFLLIHTLAPLFLRPKLETLASMQDKLPLKLTYDLIRNFPTIFHTTLPDNHNHDNDTDTCDVDFFRVPVTPPPPPPPTPASAQHGGNAVDSADEWDHGLRSTARSRLSRRGSHSTLASSSGGDRASIAGGSGIFEDVAGVAGNAWRGFVNVIRSSSAMGVDEEVGWVQQQRRSGVPGSSGGGGAGLATSPLSLDSWGWAASGRAGGGAGTMAGMDEFDELESEEEDLHHVSAKVCHWGGCGQWFEGKRALMMHIAIDHMGNDGRSGMVVIPQ
ncbi:hypothetical protein HDU98_010927 [Podochytrium sp. JEL0797]|nr:hypothetical protein HDU98_010927 [Podochytrium sp. JEL0797]